MISNWRQLWADRENARRQAEYDQATLTWRDDLEQIRRYHRLSITAGPAINTSGIRLHHGENLWWTTADASLVEMLRTVELVTPDHRAYSPMSVDESLIPQGTLRDNGFAAITNHRVLFFGALGHREWRFSQLTGVANGTREIVMRVENQRTLCGLGVAPALAAGFRFHLALALAEHGDDREGFTDHLARLLDRQQFHGPNASGPVGPADAPHPLRWALYLSRRLYFGRPGASAARQMVPALATAVLLACGLGLAAAGGGNGNGWQAQTPYRSEAPPSATPFGTPVGMPVGPVGSDSPQKDTPPPNQAPPNQAPQQEAPQKEPSQKEPSSAPPVNLCGAAANPWNFHFCDSGSLIADPPAAFCSYFPCADNFWRSTNGFVVECQDGRFSQTGGRPGACAQHGGVKRTLRG